jgi:extracellular factor (EF) 3-hydroxypalmitic acid methyl ester biosynthesis protein
LRRRAASRRVPLKQPRKTFRSCGIRAHFVGAGSGRATRRRRHIHCPDATRTGKASDNSVDAARFRRIDMLQSIVSVSPALDLGLEFYRDQLDDLHTRLLDGDVAAGFGGLVACLAEWRTQFDRGGWRTFIDRVCRAHAILPLVHSEPMTAHSFAAPRGYHGDAELLDYCYRLHRLDNLDSRSLALNSAVVSSPAPRAVRCRREILATFVDEVASETSNARILAVAAGHLREARLSAAVRDDAVREYVALDQDSQSLSEIATDPSCRRVTTVAASVRDLMAGRLDLGQFDGIYAAGLYDYLRPSTARRLSRTLFDCLRPGGRLLVANFLEGIECVGYMEAYMDWYLIYRTADEMRAVASDIPLARIAEQRQYAETNGNITFLDLRKQ